MKFRYKAILFIIVAMLIYSFSVNALTATAGASAFWEEKFTTDDGGGCGDSWAIVSCSPTTTDEQQTRTEDGCGVFDNKHEDWRLFWNFANITSYLDGLHGADDYALDSVDFVGCNSGVDVITFRPDPIWTYQEPTRTCTVSNIGFAGGNVTYDATPTSLGGNYHSWAITNANTSIGSLWLKGSSDMTTFTTESTREFVNSSGTCTAFPTDTGGSQYFYLSYDYHLTNVWNLTSPINNAEYQTTDLIYISGTNNTVLTESYNISYNVDGGEFISIANLTQLPYNFSYGLGSQLSTGTHNFSVHLNGTTLNEIENVNFTVGNVIDFCTTLTTVAFNITFADEINNTALNNVSYGMTLFTDGDTNSISKEGFGQFIEICTTTSNTGFGANVILEYNNATGSFYDKRTYFNFLNYTGGQTNITVYLLEGALGTLVDATLQDENAIPLVKKYIQLHRYNAGTNTFRIVDSGLTDENGVSPLSLDLNEVLYKIVTLDYNGNILDTTLTREITGNFILTILGSLEKTNEILNQLVNSLTYSLTYVNATKIITLTWDDTLTVYTSQQCLAVTNRTLSGINNVSQQCLNSPAGTITYNYTNDTGTDLTAIFRAVATADSNQYDVFNIVIINVNDYLNYRGNEFLFAILIIGTLAGLGALAGSIGVLVMTTLGVFITYMLGMFAISSVSLWGLVVVVVFALIMGGRKR